MQTKTVPCSLFFVVSLLLVAPLRAADQGSPSPASEPPKPVAGTVAETVNSGGYTYLLVSDGDHKVWVAAPELKVQVGDEVRIDNYMEMKGFKSKTLNRTFDSVLFAQRIQLGSQPSPATPGLPPGHPNLSPQQPALPAGHPPLAPEQPAMPPGHPNINSTAVGALKIEEGSIKKAWGGYTIEDCFKKKKSLADKTVKVRGVVVKYNPNIMGKNWLHIQDGTGRKGTDDLTVTTREIVQVGDVVLVKGTLKYNKNFGAGYAYAAIIEDASVQREKKYQE